jgi:putative transposase
VSGIPHHITQRGNRRQQTFFNEKDYRYYIEQMSEWCSRCKVVIWAYCLMPNHVHLIAVPESEDGLRRAIGEAHRRYTRQVNFREGWRGHLWQGRFCSFPMDETYLLAAVQYVELNPVRARFCSKPQEYPWSSAAAHFSGSDDALVRVSPLLDIVGTWEDFLSGTDDIEIADEIRRHESTGRPLGSEDFIQRIELTVNRVLRQMRPGRKKRDKKK